MPYPTQHENFYKNQVIQLQQELHQLTETYQHILNEKENLAARAARWAAEIAAREAADLARWTFMNSAESLARQEAARIAREAAEAAARAIAARVEAFSSMSNDAIIAAIRAATNSNDTQFLRYVSEHWGQIAQVGSSYQRLLPDGTVLHLNSNGNWVPINKPGFMSAFGTISANGRAHDPATLWQLAGSGMDLGSLHLGARPVDMMGRYGLPTTRDTERLISPQGPGY
jgi:hypothetical protein